MVGDGPLNSLSTYNVSQICNVSRYAKFVQNVWKNLAPVLRFAPVQKVWHRCKMGVLLHVGMGHDGHQTCAKIQGRSRIQDPGS